MPTFYIFSLFFILVNLVIAFSLSLYFSQILFWKRQYDSLDSDLRASFDILFFHRSMFLHYPPTEIPSRSQRLIDSSLKAIPRYAIYICKYQMRYLQWYLFPEFNSVYIADARVKVPRYSANSTIDAVFFRTFAIVRACSYSLHHAAPRVAIQFAHFCIVIPSVLPDRPRNCEDATVRSYHATKTGSNY